MIMGGDGQGVSTDPLFQELPRLLTIDVVAALLGVHRNTLRRWRVGEVGPKAHVLPGGGWRYREDEVLAWARDSCACCHRIHVGGVRALVGADHG